MALIHVETEQGGFAAITGTCPHCGGDVIYPSRDLATLRAWLKGLVYRHDQCGRLYSIDEVEDSELILSAKGESDQWRASGAP